MFGRSRPLAHKEDGIQTTLTRLWLQTSRPDMWFFHTANLLYLIILVMLRVLTQNGHHLPMYWFAPGIAAIITQMSFFLLPALAVVWLTHHST